MTVRMARAALGWSQAEFGRFLGMSQRAIHRVEQGHSEPRRTTLLAHRESPAKGRIQDRRPRRRRLLHGRARHDAWRISRSPMSPRRASPISGRQTRTRAKRLSPRGTKRVPVFRTEPTRPSGQPDDRRREAPEPIVSASEWIPELAQSHLARSLSSGGPLRARRVGANPE